MGVSHSYGELSGKLARAGAASGSVPRVATRVAGEAASGIIRAGSPSRLRGVGKKGARLGVSVSVTGSGTHTLGYVRATGPWQLIEHDTKAHDIPRSNRRKKKVLRLADGTFYTRVRHPGTRGQHPFAKGAEVAKPLIPRFYRDGENAALARIFL